MSNGLLKPVFHNWNLITPISLGIFHKSCTFQGVKMLIENFKTFFFKKDYDFDDPNISLFHFHPQIRFYYMINGIFFKNKDSKLRFILPLFNTVITLIAIAFELMFVYRGLVTEDYTFASESFSYLIILGTVPLVYISIIYNRDIIMQQLYEMNHDFLTIIKMDKRYKEPFLKGQLLIWKLCWTWQSFCMLIAFAFVMNTVVLLIYHSLFATHDENTVRPLIFPMWLPEDDPYRTPNYEIFMFFQFILIFVIEQNFIAYIYLKFHILIHYYYLMSMINLDFEVLFDDLDESVIKLSKNSIDRINVQMKLNSRFGRIVNWQTSVFRCMNRVSSVFGPPLVYQTMFSSVALCVIAFQVAKQFENGKIDFLFSIIFIAGCLQLWIPCYLGTLIRDKALAVGDACWNCGWNKTPLGYMLREDIILFILRSQIPLTIRYSALPPLTLETFSSIMSTSYSYFNMLRQFTE